MKFIPSIATGPPVLDEETFQRLLAAAHIMQECNDRHIDASKVDNPCLAGSTTAENAPPIQVLPLALQAQVPKVNPVQDVIPEARTDVEPWAARRDALIPPRRPLSLPPWHPSCKWRWQTSKLIPD